MSSITKWNLKYIFPVLPTQVTPSEDGSCWWWRSYQRARTTLSRASCLVTRVTTHRLVLMRKVICCIRSLAPYPPPFWAGKTNELRPAIIASNVRAVFPPKTASKHGNPSRLWCLARSQEGLSNGTVKWWKFALIGSQFEKGSLKQTNLKSSPPDRNGATFGINRKFS